MKQVTYIILITILILFCISCKVNKYKSCEPGHEKSIRKFNKENSKLAGQKLRRRNNPRSGVIVYFPDNKDDFFKKADTTNGNDDAIPKFTTTSPDRSKTQKYVTDTVVLYFSRNYENQLTPESFSRLYYLKEYLVRSKEVKIEIEVHCFPSNQASFWKNGYYSVDSSEVQNSVKYSEYRAMSLVNYFKKNKVKEERITYNAVGCLEPLYAKPRTKEEVMKNERVYVILIKKL